MNNPIETPAYVPIDTSDKENTEDISNINLDEFEFKDPFVNKNFKGDGVGGLEIVKCNFTTDIEINMDGVVCTFFKCVDKDSKVKVDLNFTCGCKGLKGDHYVECALHQFDKFDTFVSTKFPDSKNRRVAKRVGLKNYCIKFVVPSDLFDALDEFTKGDVIKTLVFQFSSYYNIDGYNGVCFTLSKLLA